MEGTWGGCAAQTVKGQLLGWGWLLRVQLGLRNDPGPDGPLWAAAPGLTHSCGKRGISKMQLNKSQLALYAAVLKCCIFPEIQYTWLTHRKKDSTWENREVSAGNE